MLQMLAEDLMLKNAGLKVVPKEKKYLFTSPFKTNSILLSKNFII